ncbi:outer membrane channel protein TolC [Aeromonas schubertii]|uniref:Outer membrane channel protein TolC n=1 Tax=Aeromonas schubertii TaxID=652 RepID=A0ABS7VD13_9GAMM|nr:outer membrane channel protein TolC [Aeromonas schubertii]KUE78355.1 outer membrane channel protein [Aeromonas schubertii]MBZ6067020.1 outer membrane channel protein TolC [Aeromonas schubertii]MBZ6072986.1 outer membrane channel protein TolC [Aeromonas schubertii]
MKRTLLSVLVMLGVSTAAHAENLIDIYHQAQVKDPQLLESKAKRDAAFEKINESRAALLPQINLAGTADYQNTTDDVATRTQLGAQVTLDQSIYRRSNWVNLSLTEKGATQSDVSYNLEQQSLMLRTAQAYFNVLKAQDTLEFVRANKAAVERQLEQTQQRFEVGLTAITDVNEAQAERDQALADEIQAENTLANSYETLRELTGVDYRSLDVLNTDRFSPVKSPLNSDQWLETALDKNLALHNARIGKDIAKEQIDLAKTGHEPTLDLGAGLGTTNNDYKLDNPQDGTMDQASVGLTLKLPLYSGGATTSRVKQAQHTYVAASEQLEKTFRSVQSTVRSSYNNVNSSIGAVRAYAQYVVSAESSLKATEAGYEVGTRTIVDVLDSTRKLYQAKQKLSEARYNYILSILQLKQAAGTLQEQDLAEVNQGLMPASQKKSIT